MWWLIPDILLPAHIHDLQEEVFIIRIAVSMPTDGLDLLIDSLDLAGWYFVSFARAMMPSKWVFSSLQNQSRCLLFVAIYAEVFSLLFGFYGLLAVIGRIDALETFFINLLDCVFAKSGDLCHLLVCISSSGKQVTGILMKRICNVRWPSALKEINWLLVAPHLGLRSWLWGNNRPLRFPPMQRWRI